MIPRVTATIDLSALKRNIAKVRLLAPHSKLLCVVKADAYGHDAAALLEVLNDADALAVARIDEAISLRQNHYTGRIVVLSGVLDLDEVELSIAHQLDVVVHSWFQVNLLSQVKSSASIDVWLKYDSGMNRLGFTEPKHFADALSQLVALPLVSDITLMTHFACAEESTRDFTLGQIEQFNALTATHTYPISMANSAAIIQYPESHKDWVRPGLLIYGVNPVEHSNVVFEPVMTLKSVVIAVKPVKKGDGVGYGQLWHASEDTHIAVIAIGYGDGFPRAIAQGAKLRINDKPFPIVGRISMDLTTVDIGPEPQVSVGDSVEIWGRSSSITELAKAADTIPYELLLNLTSRVHFEFS
ncbi:MAG: alanine racemase [Gammaproteobacteria bacterium]|nr:alanine racemase [Gammaproteobacteria bacterium]